MTFSFCLPHRLLSAIGVALLCSASVAYAAELEGTLVSPGELSAIAVQSVAQPAAQLAPAPEQLPVIVPEPALTPAPPVADEHEHWGRTNNQDWEHNWEKNLNQALGGEHDDAGFDPAILIPLFAIVFIFGGPIFLLCFLIVQRYGARARRQQDINNNIDKLLAAGRDIPVELLRGDEARSDAPIGSRDKGIRNIFLGTGWLIFLTVMVGFDIGSAGFIWIALGASQVLIWFLNKPKGDEQAGQLD